MRVTRAEQIYIYNTLLFEGVHVEMDFIITVVADAFREDYILYKRGSLEFRILQLYLETKSRNLLVAGYRNFRLLDTRSPMRLETYKLKVPVTPSKIYDGNKLFTGYEEYSTPLAFVIAKLSGDEVLLLSNESGGVHDPRKGVFLIRYSYHLQPLGTFKEWQFLVVSLRQIRAGLPQELFKK